MPEKRASTDYPIHTLLAERWSPYAFADRPVAEADLRSLFEAARWAPSSNNEQPWRPGTIAPRSTTSGSPPATSSWRRRREASSFTR